MKCKGRNNNPGKTYTSHDECIIKNLPKCLSEEFPAILSHRSGISRRLLNLMRSCFHSGMGPGPFARMLREHHDLRHDRLELQYLLTRREKNQEARNQGDITRYLAARNSDDVVNAVFPNKGRLDSVPTTKYLTKLYNKFVESHIEKHYHHTSTLPATIVNVDHSHKVSSITL